MRRFRSPLCWKKGAASHVHLSALPFVKHVKDELAQLGKDYLNRDVGIIGISANEQLRMMHQSR